MARNCHQTGMSLRETEHMPHAAADFTHEVVAVDADGNHVYDTESLFSHEVEGALDDYPEGEHAPDGVDHYEIREK